MGFMALGMSLHWACPFFNVTRIFCLQPPSTGWLQQDGLRIVHLNLFLDPVETKPRTKFGELDDDYYYYCMMMIVIVIIYIYKYICTALREKKHGFL